LLVYCSSALDVLRVDPAAAGTRLSENSTGAFRFTGVIHLIQQVISVSAQARGLSGFLTENERLPGVG
jgi:hypothetical protein